MKDSNFEILLKRSMNENIIVSVFSNTNQPETCSVGYVEAITKDQVIIKDVTNTGLTAGYVIRKLENVFRIDIDGMHEQKMHKLYKMQKQSHVSILKYKIDIEANIFMEILKISHNLGLVVRICVDESDIQEDIIGLVKEVSGNEVVISRIDEYGLADGESAIMLDDVVLLNCDTDEDHILKLLYQDRQTKS